MTPEEIKAIVDGITAALKPAEEAPNRKRNADLAKIAEILGLEAGADMDAIVEAIKANADEAEKAEEATAEVEAEELAGEKKIGEEVNQANRYAFEKLKGVRLSNRKKYIENVLKQDEIFKSLLRMNAGGIKTKGKTVFNGWGR